MIKATDYVTHLYSGRNADSYKSSFWYLRFSKRISLRQHEACRSNKLRKLLRGLLLGKLFFWVCCDNEIWCGFGKHSVVKSDSNFLLIQIHREFTLCFVNSMFGVKNKYKTIWILLGSKQWHLWINRLILMVYQPVWIFYCQKSWEYNSSCIQIHSFSFCVCVCECVCVCVCVCVVVVVVAFHAKKYVLFVKRHVFIHRLDTNRDYYSMSELIKN